MKCVCTYICVCACIHIYIHPQLFVFVLYFETESCFAALAGQELNCVDQAGLELWDPPPSVSVKCWDWNTSHHAQLSLSLIDYFKPFVLWYSFAEKILFSLDLKRGILFVLFIARRHTTQCYSCGHFGVDFCQTSRRADDRESVKGFNCITECFSSESLWNGCTRVTQCEVSDCRPSSPTSPGTCARFPRLFLVALQFFLWSKRRENLTDSNSLNGVIYSFKACQDKLKEHLSENAARSLLCNCRYFV